MSEFVFFSVFITNAPTFWQLKYWDGNYYLILKLNSLEGGNFDQMISIFIVFEQICNENKFLLQPTIFLFKLFIRVET